MNKANLKSKKLSTEIAMEFLESYRKLHRSPEYDSPLETITLKIPGNILEAAKLRGKVEGKKYQSLIIEYVRKGLKEK